MLLLLSLLCFFGLAKIGSTSLQCRVHFSSCWRLPLRSLSLHPCREPPAVAFPAYTQSEAEMACFSALSRAARGRRGEPMRPENAYACYPIVNLNQTSLCFCPHVDSDSTLVKPHLFHMTSSTSIRAGFLSFKIHQASQESPMRIKKWKTPKIPPNLDLFRVYPPYPPKIYKACHFASFPKPPNFVNLLRSGCTNSLTRFQQAHWSCRGSKIDGWAQFVEASRPL